MIIILLFNLCGQGGLGYFIWGWGGPILTFFDLINVLFIYNNCSQTESRCMESTVVVFV